MANEDPEYSRWVREQPCSMCMKKPPSEQHHRSGAGMALRAHDHESMPLCRDCHHHALGRLSKEDRRAFEEDAIAHMQSLYLMRGGKAEADEGVF